MSTIRVADDAASMRMRAIRPLHKHGGAVKLTAAQVGGQHAR